VTSPPRNRWTGDLGTFWAGHDEPYERMLAPLLEPLLDAARIEPGARVLDIGCGPGRTTREAARRAGPSGSALGVDISAAMVSRARSRTAAEGPPTAEFLVADAEHADLGAARFDALVSRFGLLFFDDPDTAFRALAATLRPGGRIAFTSWQARTRSPIRTVPAQALDPWIPMPPPPAPGTPGAFGLADPDRVRELLTNAGLGDVVVTDLTLPLLAGTDVAAAAAFQIAEEDAERDEPLPPEATEAMVAALEPYATADGVFLEASTWLVSATR
jgi:SAM-dependent methyltransferase